MIDNQPIKSYVIVGGGTAGWISAAVLSRALPNLNCSITLIESPNIPTIGVGEATIPSIIDLLEYLQIPLKDFLIKTNATFKLAIKFEDWYEKGQSYWHPFGTVGGKIDGKAFYQHWLKHHFNGGKYDLTDFSPAIALAKQNKFYIPEPKNPSNLSGTSYALHFDAGLVAKYLEAYCKNKNVTLIKANVDKVNLAQDGRIDSVVLNTLAKNTKTTIKGDFFIDCSGQRALLINKALRVGLKNWQHFLPVDKAVAMQTEKMEILPPFTVSKAHEHGWRWQIPLQNRTGNGYVYCSDYCSDDEALSLLQNNVKGKAITEPKIINFTTGKRERVWYKNCLAVGLSAGFLEPLESTSIYLIMKSMLNFVQSIPDKNLHEETINEYNRLMDIEYDCIRDFIVLHYCTTKRTDSDFWKMWQHLPIPDSLQTKLALFKEHGRLVNNKLDLFSEYSWYAVLEGMKVRPKAYDPIIDASVFKKIESALHDSANLLNTNASKVLSHNDFIKRLYI